MDELDRTRTIEISRILRAAIRLQAHLEECIASLGISGALVNWEVPAWDHFEEATLIAVLRDSSPLRLRFRRADLEAFASEDRDGAIARRVRDAVKSRFIRA